MVGGAKFLGCLARQAACGALLNGFWPSKFAKRDTFPRGFPEFWPIPGGYGQPGLPGVAAFWPVSLGPVLHPGGKPVGTPGGLPKIGAHIGPY